MYISKKDALTYFQFFNELPEDQPLMPYQQEIVYATLAQIEFTVESNMEAQFATLNRKSIAGRSYYVGPGNKFPKGCKSCLTGTGLTAIRKTNKCNVQCKFCYNYGEMNDIPPVPTHMFEIGGTNFYERDIPLLFRTHKKPTGVSYVFLEPFMEIEKYYGIIGQFKAEGVHQHMYTNGTLATEENLRMLGESGLDELRFNLGAANCSDKVIRNIAIAKKYIPYVGIETPMTREFFSGFQKKKEAILATGLDYINCAELHLNQNNIDNYYGEPMYMARMGYLSPIISRQITFQMMEMAEKENWGIVVHDCCNYTKFARDLHRGAVENGNFGKSDYGCEFDSIPYEAFFSVLSDDTFHFIREEELPKGYRLGEFVI